MRYKAWVCLEAEYDDIEADCEEEAFMIACEMAIEDENWCYRIKAAGEEDE